MVLKAAGNRIADFAFLQGKGGVGNLGVKQFGLVDKAHIRTVFFKAVFFEQPS